MAPDFDAIFFDLFDTLLHFDVARIPTVATPDGDRYSTAAILYRAVRNTWEVPLSEARFIECNLALDEELAVIRRKGREVPAIERFGHLAERSGLPPEAVQTLLETHMNCLRRSLACPSDTYPTLEKLAGYPMFVASNFDHAPTATRALEEFGLIGFFVRVFVSELIGWRKPSLQFFRAIESQSGFDANRCLFVGDDLECDIRGAASAGFRTVWLSRTSLPQSDPELTRINRLSELNGLLSRPFDLRTSRRSAP